MNRETAFRAPTFVPRAATVALLAASLMAQVAWPQRRYRVCLPPTRGATVLSTYIDAQARYIVAMGDYLESAAIARRHRAAAHAHEMQNAINWVKTYFERKELNRAYRRKTRPPYIDRLAKIDSITKRRLLDFPEEVVKGDVTKELNWLLVKLATAAVTGSVFEENQEIDQPLSADQVGHIVFSDGGQKNGRRLTFRASDSRALTTRWPLALRNASFDAERRNYELVKQAAAAELKEDANMKWATWTRLQAALDAVSRKLLAGYSDSQLRDFNEFVRFNTAKRYLQSQALEIHRAMTTNDARVFQQGYAFAGAGVLDLLRHMSSNGLQFAEPEAGDEATYRKLLLAMQGIYRHFKLDQQTSFATPDRN